MKHLLSPLDFSVEELDNLMDIAKDIEANPGISFEIVGYTQVVVNDFFIRSSILVQWGNNFKESE